MGHERSNTIQDPSGRWINIYGQHPDEEYPAGVSMGLTIPLDPGVSYPDSEQAVEAAKIRSLMHVPHDEMTLSEMLNAPRESTADIVRLSQLTPPTDAYTGSVIWQSGDAKAGMRPLPGNTRGTPRVYPDREAPPQRNRPSLYGRPR